MVNEPDAKAILPEPRRVQKANSYQFNQVSRLTHQVAQKSGPGHLAESNPVSSKTALKLNTL